MMRVVVGMMTVEMMIVGEILLTSLVVLMKKQIRMIVIVRKIIGTGNIIPNFFGGSNEETNDENKDSDNDESNVPNFFGIADDEETTNCEENTNNEENNIDNSNENLPNTLTVENQGSGLITNPIQQEPTSGRCPDGTHISPSGDCEVTKR